MITKINNILYKLRYRLEREERDYHFDAQREAATQFNNLFEAQHAKDQGELTRLLNGCKDGCQESLATQKRMLEEDCQKRIEQVFRIIRMTSQDIDENGEAITNPKNAVQTIYYIGKGRLQDLEDFLKAKIKEGEDGE